MDVYESKIKRPLVLVAEDDESNYKLIEAIIGKKCEILWAKNGQETLDYFEEHRNNVNIILMDIKMPIMNGLDATKAVRQDNSQIPIIVQTAYAFNSDKENALRAGATEVLVKPITLGVLRKTIGKYLPELGW